MSEQSTCDVEKTAINSTNIIQQKNLKGTVEQEQPLIHFLHSTSGGLSKSELKKALACGSVWLKRQNRKKRRVRKAQYIIRAGDIVEMYYDRHIINALADDPVLLKKTRAYSLWYKPPFLLTQGNEYGDHLSLFRFAEKTLNLLNRMFLIHRLDREACGLVLLAHTKKSADYLSKQFRNRTVQKYYRAKVTGHLKPEGKVITIDTELDNKNALSLVSICTYEPKHDETSVDVEIKTGRFHQIRRHLSQSGYPVSGDHKYGAVKNNKGALKLCASRLSYTDPVTEKAVDFFLPEKYIWFE